MRLVEYDNKKAYLTEEAVESLAKRFDWERYKHQADRDILEEDCFFINFCKADCVGCPLDVFRNGCMSLLMSIANLYGFRIKDNMISCNHSGAQEQLAKIRNAILNLPKF